MRNTILACAVLLSATAIYCRPIASAQPKPAERQQWEYTVTKASFDVDLLNDLGRNGWEAVTATIEPNGSSHIVILKRPLR